MDWTTPLRSQQADFIQRLKSGCVLHCETEGQHSELTVISGESLKQLRDFCWQMADKYKRMSSVRDVFINNMKGKLAEEVVKARLAGLVTEVDYEKRLSGDGKVDFRLTSDPSIGIQVKARHGSIDSVQWWIDQEEITKNTLLVCILIQEEVHEAQTEYNLITAGFLPTNIINVSHGKASVGVEQLLYSGGLRSYLESVQPDYLTPSSQQSQHNYQAPQQIQERPAQVQTTTQYKTLEKTQYFWEEKPQVVPAPIHEFPDLGLSVEILKEALATGERIGICGHYDADGITGTALLLRTLRWLGADVNYIIPSPLKEGYGINKRIIEEFAREGIGLVLTVNNGIYAHETITRAAQLGMKVIITDRYGLPRELPDADAFVTPKQLAESSPYRALGGVGVAFILAVSLAQELGRLQGLTDQLLELFTLGTLSVINDPIPLRGINLRWVERGLPLLHQPQVLGIQTLMEMCWTDDWKALSLGDISFHLGLPIEAVCRMSDPQIAVELLTTNDRQIAEERAMQCMQISQKLLQICQHIEREAIASIEQRDIDLGEESVIVIVQPDWHHGAISIVASRLVKRYEMPVFIGTYEDLAQQYIRGAAWGVPGFDVSEALVFCKHLLERFGGHKLVCVFSLRAEHLEELRSRLRTYALQTR
jgi:single-stranded-DNA-specific exonuclease RecJ